MKESFVKNTFFSVGYRLVNVFFPLLTIMYASRILLPDGIGEVSTGQNYAQYFAYFAALGIPTYGVKKIAEAKSLNSSVDSIFSELFIINFISTTIALLAYYFGFGYLMGNKSPIMIVMGLTIAFNYINVDWFYQGNEQFKYIMIRNLAVKCIALLMTVFFVKSSEDIITYSLILVMSTGLNNIFNIIHIRKFTKLQFKYLNICQHLLPIFMLLLSSIAIEIYTLADVTMLSILCNDTEVGLYSNAYKTVGVIRTILVSFCAVFLPRMTYHISNNDEKSFKALVNKGLSFLVLISVPAAIGAALLSQNIITFLFGNSFIGASIPFCVLCFSIISVSISNFTGTQVLIAIGKEKQLFISTLIGALVNIALNYSLIISLGSFGAAIASVISEVAVAIYQLVILVKKRYITINLKFVFSVIVSSLLMTIVVFCVIKIFNSRVLETIVSIVIGASVYFLTILQLNSINVSYYFSIMERKYSQKKNRNYYNNS